jgi:two-component system, NarL family, invasion response regulator UvrY
MLDAMETMTVSTTRVLIVDDQAAFRSAARLVVDMSDGFEVVGEAETGEEAVTLVGRRSSPTWC